MLSIKRTPFKGSEQTVSDIIKKALAAQDNFSVRQIVEDICRDLRSKDYLSEMLAVYHFVLANTRYMRDPKTVELVKNPVFTVGEIRNGKIPQLDCDDLTVLLAAMLLSLGCGIRIATVAFKHAFYAGQRQYSHVFVQAYEPRSKTWITLDPVAGEKTKTMMSRAVAVKIYNVI